MAARKRTRKKTVTCRLCQKGGFAKAASVYWHHVDVHGKKHGGRKAAATKKANGTGLPSRSKSGGTRNRPKKPRSKEGYGLVLKAIPTSDLWAELGDRLEL